jgi:CheY-like chemotaxis protein
MARILVIDDEAQVRLVMRRALEKEGHEVVSAENGEIGIQRYREKPADLVIADLMMPSKGGAETIFELKNIDPQVRVLGISGGDVLDDIVFLSATGKLGSVRWLAKPFANAELITTVTEMLSAPATSGDSPTPDK